MTGSAMERRQFLQWVSLPAVLASHEAYGVQSVTVGADASGESAERTGDRDGERKVDGGRLYPGARMLVGQVAQLDYS